MHKALGKWLKIYEDELSLFFWVALLLFFIRTSSILFNNFADTAFLKRFGVEYLPILYVANSITTFVIMGAMTGIMARLPGSRMLFYTLIFCGASVGALSFVVKLHFHFIYPVLFVLKLQYAALLTLVFWNLANDLFNTRQSKRLFPLIIAAGVIGGIIGSFATPALARAIDMDNLLWAYFCTTMLGAVAVKSMGARFPTLLVSDKKGKKGKKRTSTIEQFKMILPMVKESKLVKILILLTFLPNVAIPIINYQFNFAVNQQFARQQGLLDFFGYFNGALGCISLILLLFISRLYGRLGLPVVLLFHPVNYMIAFLAFLVRFDIFSAVYARVSRDVIRTTMFSPARAVLMGLFPVSYRAAVRPFLRGTVVRVGVLLGSGIIIASEGLFAPRYLSMVGMVFAAGWIFTTFYLKRSYSDILLGLISRNMLDMKSLEEQDIGNVFADKKIQSQLIESFLSSRGDDCLWYARLLNSQGLKDLDTHILAALKQNDPKTRVQLLGMLSPDAGWDAIQVFEELVDPDNPDQMVALVKAANRLPKDLSAHFAKRVFETNQDFRVKAYALTGLYPQAPQEYKGIIDSWLDSHEASQRRAGVLAAGGSGDEAFVSRLEGLLGVEEDISTLSSILDALRKLDRQEINTLAGPYLSHFSPTVRLSALDAFQINDDEDIRTVIGIMGDSSDMVHERAKNRLQDSSYQNVQVLIESLNIPRRKVREGLFDLLESLNIKDLDVFRFARTQVERCYTRMVETDALGRLPESRERNLLMDHLENKKQVELENILRVLAIQDRSGQMRIVWRGIFSANARQRSNSVEVLDDLMDPSLSRIMLQLLEGLPPDETLKAGRKHFQLPYFDSGREAICSHFLTQHNEWVTLVLALNLIAEQGLDGIERRLVQQLEHAENVFVRQMARMVLDKEHRDTGKREDEIKQEMTIPDKILHLRGINIFEGLSVGELAAIGSVVEESVYPKGETVIKEGGTGDTMYLIISGEVSVIKGREGEQGGREIELARMRAGDYFGEMALFEDAVRSATIRTAEESRLLVIHKQEFTEIVREYPQIALHICKALSGRIRELHKKVKIRGN